MVQQGDTTAARLAALRASIAHVGRPAKTAGAALPFGVGAIDSHLPGGGLALGALHEVAGGGPDVEHGATAMLLIGGVLARLPGQVLWVLERPDLFAPALGVWIDATGCAHLFGGEGAMLTDVVERLAQSGVAARAAIADTAGAAWAAARFAKTAATVAAAGETAAALRPLPIAALRLDDETIAGLARLGFDRIDQLLDAPRAPLTLRFGREVIRRIDQVSPPHVIASRLSFPEPLLTPEALSGVIARLARMVCDELERRAEGARRLDLTFERVDRTEQVICIGTARPSRRPDHLARLLDEHLERIDPGLGVEAMRLAAPLTEPLAFEQLRAGLIAGETTGPDVSMLVDRLVNRLGARKVYRAAPVESDVPERSVRHVGPLSPPTKAAWPPALPRPTRLLKPPQPVEALAMLPDHPPAQFIWRRKRHRIRRADGPERIAGEWWTTDRERSATRDYWQVEDEDGRRFWLFRSGDAVDPATGDLRWFLHGFF